MAFNAKAASAIGGILLAAAAAAPTVMKWEGWENRAYPDVINVWTACMGTTRGIKPGDVFTDQQCQTKAVQELAEYAVAIAPCLPAELPVQTRAAFISVAYNIGPPAFCKSSMSRKALAGDLPGACDALLMWNKAGGQVVRGLDNRRRDERALCLKGLA